MPKVELHQFAASLLPSSHDELVIRKNFAILVLCVLVSNIALFKLAFDDIVEWHMKHNFYEEMSRKSTVIDNFK